MNRNAMCGRVDIYEPNLPKNFYLGPQYIVSLSPLKVLVAGYPSAPYLRALLTTSSSVQSAMGRSRWF